MPEGESKPEEKKPRFNQEQYDMLIRCSEERDIADWNQWRWTNERGEMKLEGVDLRGAYLDGANLSDAHLEGAHLSSARLKGADLAGAHLEGADLLHARLVGAGLWGAHLEGAKLFDAHLAGATLTNAHLEKANIVQARLQGANLLEAHLESAILDDAHLEGAIVDYAAVDGSSSLAHCTFDRETSFAGVPLANAIIAPGLRTALEANVRRMQWDEWCAETPWRRWPWKLFWWISDYGQSTRNILRVFFGLAALFAFIYLLPGFIRYCADSEWPGEFVSGLHTVDREGRAALRVPAYVVPFRALYFSVVTMTTLGFGDIHAQPDSFAGHLLLTVQVLLGYVLLGALIARLGIIYQSLGPQKDPTPPGQSGNRNGKTACEARE